MEVADQLVAWHQEQLAAAGDVGDLGTRVMLIMQQLSAQLKDANRGVTEPEPVRSSSRRHLEHISSRDTDNLLVTPQQQRLAKQTAGANRFADLVIDWGDDLESVSELLAHLCAEGWELQMVAMLQPHQGEQQQPSIIKVKLLQLLGGGGCGTVYECAVTQAGRSYAAALKFSNRAAFMPTSAVVAPPAMPTGFQEWGRTAAVQGHDNVVAGGAACCLFLPVPLQEGSASPRMTPTQVDEAMQDLRRAGRRVRKALESTGVRQQEAQARVPDPALGADDFWLLSMTAVQLEVYNGTLAELLDHRPLTYPELAVLAYKLATGLGVLRRANILHRDLKPSNILVRVNVPLDPANASDAANAWMDIDLTDEGTEVVIGDYRLAADVAGYGSSCTSLLLAPGQAAGVCHGSKVDTWGYGNVLADCLLGCELATELRQQQQPGGGTLNALANGAYFSQLALANGNRLLGFSVADTAELLEVLVNTLQVREHQRWDTHHLLCCRLVAYGRRLVHPLVQPAPAAAAD